MICVEVASVWKEEINKALMLYTKSVVKIEREGKPYEVPVQMRKPDESLKIEKYPCITWYNTLDRVNVYRTDNVERTYYNPETGEVVNYFPPEPVDLFYRIDFWAKLWGDIDAMTMKWLQALPPYSRGAYFNLPVIDSLGNKTSVLCIQRESLRRSDTLTEGQKLLRSTMTYRIQGYLGREYKEHDDVILSVDVETESKRRK